MFVGVAFQRRQTLRPSVERTLSCSASRRRFFAFVARAAAVHLLFDVTKIFFIAASCRRLLAISRRFDLRRHRPTRLPSSTVVSGERPVARYDVIACIVTSLHMSTHEYTILLYLYYFKLQNSYYLLAINLRRSLTSGVTEIIN